MSKTQQIYELIVKHTYPKDQLGFYSEQDLYNDIDNIINGSWYTGW